MISFFDRIYLLLSKCKYSNTLVLILLRRFIKVTYNLIIPVYFIIRLLFFKKNSLKKKSIDLIVSMTSFKKRINKTWISVVSIFLQVTKPNRIILWLSIDEFSSIKQVPLLLKFLMRYGLEIKFCNSNYLGHKKYIHLEHNMINSIIITVDDDIIYNKYLISTLLDYHHNNANSICCSLAYVVKINDLGFEPYSYWPPALQNQYDNYVFPVGAGGVLYPPDFFKNFLFEFAVINDICLYADDIWLFVVSRYIGYKSLKVPFHSSYLPLIYLNNSTLYQSNVINKKNDIQLNNVYNYFKNVKNFNLLLFLNPESKC